MVCRRLERRTGSLELGGKYLNFACKLSAAEVNVTAIGSKMSKYLSEADKKAILRATASKLNNGKTLDRALKELNVNPGSYYAWKKKYGATQATTTESAPVQTTAQTDTDTRFVVEVPIPPHILQTAVKQYLAQKLNLNQQA